MLHIGDPHAIARALRSPDRRGKLHKLAAKLNMKTKHRPGGFKCKGIDDRPAMQREFEHNGQMVTVVKYFKLQYNMQLKHPELPCLVHKGRQGLNYTPMEVVEIKTGQEYRRTHFELESRERDAMLKAFTKVASIIAPLTLCCIRNPPVC